MILPLAASLMLHSQDGPPPATFLAPGAKIEAIASGLRFTEGPLELPDGRLIFSDIPANKIYSWKDGKLETFREPSFNANGNILDGKGRIITCEHGSRRVTLWNSAGGDPIILAEKYDGKKLNSPNDAVVSKAGRIYFTDPPYGIKPDEAELDFQGVYMVDPAKGSQPILLVKDFNRPNGIIISPDQKTLYVADTAEGHIRAFAIKKDGTLGGSRIHAVTPFPDGLRVDKDGRIWSASGDGVNVISKDGRVEEVIRFPQNPANLCFSRDGKTLYVTARTAVYRVRVNVKGLAP